MPQEIDHWSPVPKYQQLAQILRGRIERGEFDQVPDRKLPSEAALMNEYGLARNTVRQALGVLRDAGMIETVRLRGSQGAPPQPVAPVTGDQPQAVLRIPFTS